MNRTFFRLLTVLMAICLLLPSMVAFATPDRQDGDISGKYIEGTASDIQAVDIKWGGLVFEYQASSTEWDIENHVWKPTSEAKWVVSKDSSCAIVITNHSSVAIDVSMSAEMNFGLGCEFKINNEPISNNQFTIPKPDEGAQGAKSTTVTVMPTGALSADNTEFVKIGSVTILLDSQIVEPEMFTVTFKDWDGTILKTESVAEGKSATAPKNPTREGYVFVKWDKAFDNVKTDLVVNAVYEEASGATIYVGTVEAKAGDTVEVPVYIRNNTGVAGAMITMTFDDGLTLTNAISGETFAELTYTKPGKYTSPCNFSWDSESGMVVEDGIILTLVFKVSDTAKVGDVFNITGSYRNGDIYDENLNNVDISMLAGSITVK